MHGKVKSYILSVIRTACPQAAADVGIGCASDGGLKTLLKPGAHLQVVGLDLDALVEGVLEAGGQQRRQHLGISRQPRIQVVHRVQDLWRAPEMSSIRN